MRFLADMGVAMRVVEWLRDQGYDARHLREEELQRLPDDQIFRKAVAENRVVLTLDLDFGEIVAFSGPRTNQRIGQLEWRDAITFTIRKPRNRTQFAQRLP
jgi:predicted nuclease of predicted toxin-antitoxin system